MPTISGFTVVLADRVKETTSTTGTGTYSLNGAATGFRTFVAGVGSGNRCPYVAQLSSNWEVGIGTVTSGAPATITRDVILASSNAGSAVNWGAGTKDIYLDVPAGWLTQIPGADIGDYSSNQAEMRIQTNPGESGSESLPTDLTGELSRIRFAIAELKGTTYWYETAGLTLGGTGSGLRAALATTSGTEKDFTSIPSGANIINGMFTGLSTNGTAALALRIGDSGGFAATGYVSNSAGNTNTTLFLLNPTMSASATYTGVFTLRRMSGNKWILDGSIANDDTGGVGSSLGHKTLTGALDRVRLLTTASDVFDAGSFAIWIR